MAVNGKVLAGHAQLDRKFNPGREPDAVSVCSCTCYGVIKKDKSQKKLPLFWRLLNGTSKMLGCGDLSMVTNDDSNFYDEETQSISNHTRFAVKRASFWICILELNGKKVEKIHATTRRSDSSICTTNIQGNVNGILNYVFWVIHSSIIIVVHIVSEHVLPWLELWCKKVSCSKMLLPSLGCPVCGGWADIWSLTFEWSLASGLRRGSDLRSAK